VSQVFTEASYENSVIELFKNMEYQHIYGPDIERDFYSPFYEEELENMLHNINKRLSYVVIQEAINNMKWEYTILIIAHRLSTVIDSDRIIVIDKGQIVEEGNHKALLKKKGLYYNLYNNGLE